MYLWSSIEMRKVISQNYLNTMLILVCDLRECVRFYNEKIVFIEIGCRSADTCSSMPWDFSHKDLPYNQDEQAMFYDTCLETFSGKDWFGGMFWWDWSTFIYDDEETASKDVGFNIHLKKAEKVLRDWYAKL